MIKVFLVVYSRFWNSMRCLYSPKYQVEIVFNLQCINKVQSNDTLESNLSYYYLYIIIKIIQLLLLHNM